jgi:hypothetical protein
LKFMQLKLKISFQIRVYYCPKKLLIYRQKERIKVTICRINHLKQSI